MIKVRVHYQRITESVHFDKDVIVVGAHVYSDLRISGPKIDGIHLIIMKKENFFTVKHFSLGQKVFLANRYIPPYTEHMFPTFYKLILSPEISLELDRDSLKSL